MLCPDILHRFAPTSLSSHPATAPPRQTVIANLTRSHFDTLSADLAGKAEPREVLQAATERRKMYQKETILFVEGIL